MTHGGESPHKESAIKRTLPSTAVQPGDTLVGYRSPVTAVTVDGWRVTILFANGEQLLTSDHFRTTVIRESAAPRPLFAQEK